MIKIVYFFCTNPEIDPVAKTVYNYLESISENLSHIPNIYIDENPVYRYQPENGYLIDFVAINDVLSHDYEKYLPIINEYFSDYDFAGVINWHEGQNAPNPILTIHSTGDVPSGTFAPINPTMERNIMLAMEQKRQQYGLTDYRVLVEATHWSGIPYQQNPDLIELYKVPVYDIEIGSIESSWNNPAAAKCIFEGLLEVSNNSTNNPLLLLGIGGKHFEETFSQTMLDESYNCVFTHILPNQWFAREEYLGEQGLEKLEKLLFWGERKIDAIIFHDNLKGVYKEQCRKIAAKHGIYIAKHKALHDLAKLCSEIENNSEE